MRIAVSIFLSLAFLGAQAASGSCMPSCHHSQQTVKGKSHSDSHDCCPGGSEKEEKQDEHNCAMLECLFSLKFKQQPVNVQSETSQKEFSPLLVANLPNELQVAHAEKSLAFYDTQLESKILKVPLYIYYQKILIP